MQVYIGIGDQQISVAGRKLGRTAPFLGLRLDLQSGEELFARILTPVGGGAHQEQVVYLVYCPCGYEQVVHKLANGKLVEFYALSAALAANFTRSETNRAT